MKASRIAIVEDEAVVAMDIEDRLAAMGYELAGRADSGEQAIALAEQQKPDLILMDIRLRGSVDGISAAEEIRKRFRLPIIFLTAYSEEATLDRAKLVEPYGYILKPFDDRELKSALEIALYKHEAEEEIRRLNRLYDVLSQVNQAIVYAKSREELLSTVCRLVVERGAVDLAWIGWLDASTSRIEPVACFGNNTGIMDEAGFYSNSRPEGQGNPGKAIREGVPFVCNECHSPDCLYPAANAPTRFGFQSCGSFPIKFQDRICGVLSLCVSQAGFFRDREINLLKEIAMDISFALDKIESEIRRKRAEAALREHEEQLRLFIEHAPASLAMLDSEMRYLAASRRWLRDYNLGERDLTGLSHYEVFPDLPKYWKSVHLRALAGEVLRKEADRFERGDGSAQFLNWEIRPWRDRAGDVGGVVIFTEDVTERELAESKLREYEKVVEGLEEMIVVVDRNICCLIANRAFLDYWGTDKDEIIGCSIADISGNETFEKSVKERLQECFQGNIVRYEIRYNNRKLGQRDLAVTFLPIEGAGSVDRVACVLHDITERKRMEEEQTKVEAQLRQAQKMEALGTLAGGIAHDFNNILGIILGYTEIVLADMEERDRRKTNLEAVLNAGNRARDLVQQILAFSRRSEQEKRPLQVGIVVKEVMKMLRASLPTTIEIRHNLSSKAAILADSTQIHQLLMNLCTNAAHAMEEGGGILEVNLEDVLLDSESAPDHSGLNQGRNVKLTVKDTGHGIDPAIMDRIFDPFFTTKAQGTGTGLGLSVVHGIVKSHGGTIQVDSAPGEGTTFNAFLPALETLAELPKAESAPIPRGRENILVVDDEPALAFAAAQMLERLGYMVQFRTTGADALMEIRHRSKENPYDLVVTDMTMPHITGIDLALEIQQLHPGLPVILCTGFSGKVDAERAKTMGIRGFLTKPFALSDLAAIVRKVLDRER